MLETNQTSQVVWGPILTCLFIIIVFVAAFGIAGCANDYENRIEEKYNIEVTEINNMKYGGGTVIFLDSEGNICSADQADNDVLVGVRCGEP